jgi:hypothetical protein
VEGDTKRFGECAGVELSLLQPLQVKRNVFWRKRGA